jgi:ribulose-phosphate 3-epimerase
MAALIAPSILSADFANLERDLGRIADADYAHVDVMDNHFVPNLTLGLPIFERLAKVSPIPRVALRPATPVEPYLDLLAEIDMILVMTVEPGFGGQSFIEGTLPKIRRAREAVSESGLDVWIQVDGGVSRETIERAADAGANVFVAGSAVYGAEDIPAEIATLRELASKHTH